LAEQAIVAYTESVASEIARTYAGAPFDELRVWVRIAHQREAMVTQLYEVSEIEGRLGALNDGGAGSVARDVISSIWAHEESHTRFLGTLRSLSDSLSGIVELQGRLEGRITRSAAAGGVLARMLIAIGASLKSVPDFASELRCMNLGELVQFHGELETTALMGYRRILELQRALGADEGAAHEFGYTFPYDVARILCEERFHEDTFHAMARWVAPDGMSFAAIPGIECAKILHDLCERNLCVRTVQQTLAPSTAISKGGEEPTPWVSDGGLGQLFSRYDLPVPLVTADDALRLGGGRKPP
jgi:hypothetical protein